MNKDLISFNHTSLVEALRLAYKSGVQGRYVSLETVNGDEYLVTGSYSVVSKKTNELQKWNVIVYSPTDPDIRIEYEVIDTDKMYYYY
jgi:hypothetical protein